MSKRTIYFLVASLTIPALAQAQKTTVAQKPAAPAAANASSITEEKAGLRAKAKITADAAIATAAKAAPAGAVFTKGELEEENGKLIYTLQFKVPGKRGIKEINVDAVTGSIVNEEDEDEDDAKPETKVKPAAKKP